MVPYFPRQISTRAFVTYLVALVIVSFAFTRHIMQPLYFILGITWVAGFFFFTNYWSKNWHKSNDNVVISRIFWIALTIRLIWVVCSYFYYIRVTGIPFEFATADALGYHEEAKWLAGSSWRTAWRYYFGPESYGVSDVGYPLYLTCIYKLFGPQIIIPRIIKAFISSWTCVLVYKLSERTFGRDVARMAGIMMALMPNLVIYCGYHLKETEMLFLEVAFLERLDDLIRNPRARLINAVVASVLALSLFFFRTVLGAAAVFSAATTVLISNVPSMKKGWKRLALLSWGVLCLAITSGGTIANEIEGVWEEKDTNAIEKRQQQTSRGNQWAQYATGTVMAPMVMVLPFSTMVEVDQQYSQEEKHSGNYVRNFMGIFAILGIYEAFRRKKWRDFAMIGSFVVAYLGVISLSGYVNAERFLLPGLPGLIMIWSYGINTLRARTFNLVKPWCIFIVIAEIAWAYFKIGSRGLL